MGLIRPHPTPLRRSTQCQTCSCRHAVRLYILSLRCVLSPSLKCSSAYTYRGNVLSLCGIGEKSHSRWYERLTFPTTGLPFEYILSSRSSRQLYSRLMSVHHSNPFSSFSGNLTFQNCAWRGSIGNPCISGEVRKS